MRPGSKKLDLSWLTARPIAHRGLHDKSKSILENTASAFQAAIDHNYAIECDLQLSADGEAMVFHDDTLHRVMQADGAVIDKTAAELKSLSYKMGSDHMQSLAELLAQVAGRVPLIIELKSHWNGNDALPARVVEIMQDYQGPFALMSFDPDMVEALADFAPHMPRGITADRTTDAEYNILPLSRRLEMRYMTHLDRTRPDFVSYHAAGLPFPPVRALRAAGLPVICWTIRSVEEERQSHHFADQITFEGYLA
jgi:glycerophosphoryl diester phosphodiesterase